MGLLPAWKDSDQKWQQHSICHYIHGASQYPTIHTTTKSFEWKLNCVQQPSFRAPVKTIFLREDDEKISASGRRTTQCQYFHSKQPDHCAHNHSNAHTSGYYVLLSRLTREKSEKFLTLLLWPPQKPTQPADPNPIKKVGIRTATAQKYSRGFGHGPGPLFKIISTKKLKNTFFKCWVQTQQTTFRCHSHPRRVK